MKVFLFVSSLIIMLLSMTGCGQDGAAIGPGGASGSTINEVSADCNGESCI